MNIDSIEDCRSFALTNLTQKSSFIKRMIASLLSSTPLRRTSKSIVTRLTLRSSLVKARSNEHIPVMVKRKMSSLIMKKKLKNKKRNLMLAIMIQSKLRKKFN